MEVLKGLACAIEALLTIKKLVATATNCNVNFSATFLKLLIELPFLSDLLPNRRMRRIVESEPLVVTCNLNLFPN